MDDIWILKIADYLANCIALANICQKLIAQAFSCIRTAHKACDINKFNACGHNTRRMHNVCQAIEALIRNTYDTNIWIDCRERVIRGKARLFGKGSKKRGFSNVRKSYNSY